MTTPFGATGDFTRSLPFVLVKRSAGETVLIFNNESTAFLVIICMLFDTCPLGIELSTYWKIVRNFHIPTHSIY